MMAEVPDAAGVVLWNTHRDVTLWAGVAEPKERTRLFAALAHERRLREIEDAGAAPALDAPLRVLAGICRVPADVSESEVLAACREVARWAEDRGHLATAIAFAQAGSLAAPTDAAAACEVGRLAHRKSEHARAESWFRRTIALARESSDWESYAAAFLAIGNLYIRRYNHPAARRFLVRALRAARRHDRREIQARALHSLFETAVHLDRAAEAQELARAAFDACGASYTRLPALAYDVGVWWMTQGRFSEALAVLQAVLPHVEGSFVQIRIQGEIGRAAGAAGNRDVFDRVWDEVWSHAGGDSEWTGVFLDLAIGAASLEDWSRAEKAARAGRDIVQRYERSRVLREADAVLDSVSQRRAQETTPSAALDPADVTALAADLVRTLAAAAAED